MMKMSVTLVAISKEEAIADRLDLNVLMSRALKMETRMKKEVNLEDEQRRYLILCERMENQGSLISARKKLDSVDLGTEYLEMVMKIQQRFPEEAKKARLLANFCPTDLIESQIALFEDLAKKSGFDGRTEVKNKIAFYKKAKKNNCHVLELQEMTFGEPLTTGQDQEKLMTEFLAIPVRDDISVGQKANAFVSLKEQINRAIKDLEKGIPSGVSFSDLSHNVITEVLHEYVYKSGKPLYLPVVYADGTKARPFPIHCLKEPKAEKLAKITVPTLNTGMLSSRHPEMDPNVKIYFYRNQEISTGKTAAETDEVAYQKAKEIFEALRNDGPFKIAYYQTGFQPAIVGFYRALTEELLSRGKADPTLEITPVYYFGEYEKGKIWA